MIKGCCFDVATLILSSFLALAIGLILGAVFSAAILANIGAVIAAAVILAILLAIQLIRIRCYCNSRRACRERCCKCNCDEE